MTGVVKVPNNVTAITLGDGAHVPDASFNLTDASDLDLTVLVESYNKPKIVTTNPATNNTTISLPPNVTAITIAGNPYVPDGTQLNTITGPDQDMTLVVQQGFILVDSLT